MKDIVVRIQQLELKKVKNVEYGNVIFQNAYEKKVFSDSADVVGFYGQNGSGKTTIIDVIQIMARLMGGFPLLPHTDDVISEGEKYAEIKCVLSLDDRAIKHVVSYEFLIQKDRDGAFVSEEKLCRLPYYKETKEWREDEKEIIWKFKYDKNEKGNAFVAREDADEKLYHQKLNDMIEKKVIYELTKQQHTSFIFSRRGMMFIRRVMNEKNEKQEGEAKENRRIIMAINSFAKRNIMVFNNIYNGYINAQMSQPFTFKIVENNVISIGNISIPINGASVVSQKVYHLLEKLIDQMNFILPQIVPGCTLEVKNYGESTTENGYNGIRMELISHRNNHEFPIRCESDGIKKIISILNALIQVYNEETACVAIDELDAGIFEYLLGDLIYALKTGAKGQLIFTSHNSRPLEMLDRASVVFTTANPQNRYIRMETLDGKSNLRSDFYRSIHLGGQEEKLYEAVNVYDLQHSMRNAGIKEVKSDEN